MVKKYSQGSTDLDLCKILYGVCIVFIAVGGT